MTSSRRVGAARARAVVRVDRRAQQDHQPADVDERQRAQPALVGVEAERDRASRARWPRCCRRSARPAAARRSCRRCGRPAPPPRRRRGRGPGRPRRRAERSPRCAAALALRASRGSTGTAAAPASRQACRATTKSRPGGSASATRPPARRPRAPRRGARRAARRRSARPSARLDRDAVGPPRGGAHEPWLDDIARRLACRRAVSRHLDRRRRLRGHPLRDCPATASRRSRSTARRCATPSGPQTLDRDLRRARARPRGPRRRRDHPHRRGPARVLLGRRPARARRHRLRRRAARRSGASTSPTCTCRSAGCPSRSWRWSPATRSAAGTCCTSSATSRSPPTTRASARPARGSARSTAASAPALLAEPRRARRRPRRSGSSAASTTRSRRSTWAWSTPSCRSSGSRRRPSHWCREMLALSPFALRLLKASFHAAEDGFGGIQQLAHDANLLFYAQRGGEGGPRGLQGEAHARLLAVPATPVSATA